MPCPTCKREEDHFITDDGGPEVRWCPGCGTLHVRINSERQEVHCPNLVGRLQEAHVHLAYLLDALNLKVPMG